MSSSPEIRYKIWPQAPRRDALPQRIEKRVGGLQVGGFKALAEAIVHRLQMAARLGESTLIMLQARKAGGCSQLP
jgi:hypothetical protein